MKDMNTQDTLSTLSDLVHLLWCDLSETDRPAETYAALCGVIVDLVDGLQDKLNSAAG